VNLLSSIVLATILGFLLLIAGQVGVLIAFGIVLGCLFRGLYLLNDISKRLSKVTPKSDKVKDALERHLEERGKINQG
jgi:hypothetical protein